MVEIETDEPGIWLFFPESGPARNAASWEAMEDVARLAEWEDFEVRVMLVRRRGAAEAVRRLPEITGPGEAAQILYSLELEPREVVLALLLDGRHRVIGIFNMAIGSVNRAPIYARTLAQSSLAANAAAVMLVHNHPSGDARLTSEDKAVFQMLKDALEPFEVRVLDFLATGTDGTWESMTSRGKVTRTRYDMEEVEQPEWMD